MASIVPSMAVAATAYFGVNLTTLRTETQKLATSCADACSARYTPFFTAADPLFVGLICVVSATTLQIATNWYGPLLSWGLNRTCPAHYKESAGTRQGDQNSSHVSVQPSSNNSVAGGRRRNVGAKRSGDDGSDAENNDRDKRRRTSQTKTDNDSQKKLRCPFKARYPHDPQFETCSAFDDHNRLREHLLARRHKPRDQCQTCGEIFFVDFEFEQHTSARTCQAPPEGIGPKPICVERHQAGEIRGLTLRGRKNKKSFEEMYREVCEILFGAPGPEHMFCSQDLAGLGGDLRDQELWDPGFKRKIADVLGLQDVPGDDAVQRLWDLCRRENPRRVVQGPAAGEPAVDEHLGTNRIDARHLMPSPPPPEGQIPQPSGPDQYAPGAYEGELGHPLSHSPTHTGGGVGDRPPAEPLDSLQTSSLGYMQPSDDSQFIDPSLLQRTHAPRVQPPGLSDRSSVLFSGSTSTALFSSQATMSSALESFDSTPFMEACSPSDSETTDLSKFDFSISGAPMQPSESPDASRNRPVGSGPFD